MRIFGDSNIDQADFSQANLTHSYFFVSNSSTIFSQADTRSSNIHFLSSFTKNTIHPDGTLYGLNLVAGDSMRLWDYDDDTPLPIHVIDQLDLDATATLKIVVEDSHWGSTLNFEAGIPVNLDGTLDLCVAPDETANLTSLIGSSYQLFDWTGVTPAGTFAQITTGDGLVWDTSQLYTTGMVTLLEVPGYLFGDFNENGLVDGIDFLTLQQNLGLTSGATGAQGDADGDGDVDRVDLRIFEARFGTDIIADPGDLDGNGIYNGLDFLKWQRLFGNLYDTTDYEDWQSGLTPHSPATAAAVIPEPTTATLLLLATLPLLTRRQRQ